MGRRWAEQPCSPRAWRARLVLLRGVSENPSRRTVRCAPCPRRGCSSRADPKLIERRDPSAPFAPDGQLPFYLRDPAHLFMGHHRWRGRDRRSTPVARRPRIAAGSTTFLDIARPPISAHCNAGIGKFRKMHFSALERGAAARPHRRNRYPVTEFSARAARVPGGHALFQGLLGIAEIHDEAVGKACAPRCRSARTQCAAFRV